MINLAFIELIGADGKEHKVPAVDVADVIEVSVGAQVTMRDGRVFLTQTTATNIKTALDALWTEYLTSLGGSVPRTYTPTLTNVANVAASTAYACQYVELGSVVLVSGKIDIDPTLTATSTQLGISLPVASDFSTAEQCGGVAFASGIASQGAAILADTTNNRAQLQFVSGDITNQPMYFVFMYQKV